MDQEKIKLVEELRQAEARAFKAEEELKYLKMSRLIGRVIKFRDFARSMQKKILLSIKKVEYFLADRLSRETKDKIKYILKREWLIKEFLVENKKWPKNKPLVSIVTPTWNRGEGISKTVSSVLSQTFQNFEYIIVDDGSRDECTAYLKKIKNPKIKIIYLPKHEESHPPALARNKGISLAMGKYVVCLDDDDWLEPTFLEKALTVIETNPNISIVTSYQRMFGARTDIYRYAPYNQRHLTHDNMVMCASLFKKEAWKVAGGYKEGIGYEDWEHWIGLAEHGYWGKLIPEPLFNYCVNTKNSRYLEDMDSHGEHLKFIKDLHPNYLKNIKKIEKKRRFKRLVVTRETAYINLSEQKNYQAIPARPNVLIAIPWMTFGGAETLIYNFTKEIQNDFNLSFVTGLPCDNEWEYKFKEISPYIYHLSNLFGNNKDMYLEFISNYIRVRRIDILHVIHTNFVNDFLPELKKRFPNLRIVVTMFNDRVEYFNQSLEYSKIIDSYSTDNKKVANSYKDKLGNTAKVRVIPNGIDGERVFNINNFHPEEERANLNIKSNEISVFFIGRLSKEKNPDVFTSVAGMLKDVEGLRFFIVGDGPMRQEIESRIEKLNGAKITYLGYQSEIAKYLSASDIFVLPSAIEGFPLSILEAMAMKNVIIASRVGAIPDVIEDRKTGFIVTPGSAKEIAKIINQLKENPKRIKEIGALAREEFEKKYSNKVLKKNYKDFYKEVLK